MASGKLQTNMAEDVTFDAAEFQHVLVRGVGSGRHAASTRVSARSAAAATAATSAMQAFAASAADESAGAPDVVAAYLAQSPTAAELFAALWVGAARPAVAAAALDCLLAIARYARPCGTPGAAPRARVPAALERARSVVKDAVKGRAAALFRVLVASTAPAAATLSDKALTLLTVVAGSHPLLAKETVNRFDLGARAVAPALCNANARETRRSFCNLVSVLLSCGDRDVLLVLATRMRQAIVCCLSSFAERVATLVSAERDGADLRDEDARAIRKVLDALRERVLGCPNLSVVRSAFEPPVLDTVAQIARHSRGEVGSRQVDAVCRTARHLFDAVLGFTSQVATTPHVSRILAHVPVAESQSALDFVLQVVDACPRAARMVLQTSPHVFAPPELSLSWLAAAAVICRCVRELRTPTPVFARAKFFEKCWAHENAIVRHYGALIACSLCQVLLKSKSQDACGRLYLPPLANMEALLRKSSGTSVVVHRLYGCYRLLFRKEFGETKSDAVRIAMDAGFGKSPCVLQYVVRASLHHSTEETVATVFHKNLFSALATCMRSPCRTCFQVVKSILSATGLFPVDADHEIDIWLEVLTNAKSVSAEGMRDFENLVAEAWAKPYALFDEAALLCDEGALGMSMSLLSCAALRRLDKLLGKVYELDSVAERHRRVAPEGSLEAVLIRGLRSICSVDVSHPARERINALLNHWENVGETQNVSAVSPWRRLSEKVSAADLVESLLDINCPESVLHGLLPKVLTAHPRFPHSADGVLLFIRMCCLESNSGAELAAKAISCEVADMDRAVLAAVALRTPVADRVLRPIMEELYSRVSADSLAKASPAWDFVNQAVVDYVHGLRGTALLNTNALKRIISATWSKEPSANTLWVVRVLHSLALHESMVLRSCALQVAEEQFSAGSLVLECGKVPKEAALYIGDLIEVLPCIRNSFLSELLSGTLCPHDVPSLLPAIARLLLSEKPLDSDDMERMCSAVLRVLLSCDATTVDVEDVPYDPVPALELVIDGAWQGCLSALAASLVKEFVTAQVAFQRSNSFSCHSLSCRVTAALVRRSSSKAVKLSRLDLIELVISFRAVSGTVGDLLHFQHLVRGLQEPGALRDVDLARVEKLETYLAPVILFCCTHALDHSVFLEVAQGLLGLDLMFSKVAEDGIVSLANTIDVLEDCKTQKISLETLAGFISVALGRLRRLEPRAEVARSLATFEGLFCNSAFEGRSSPGEVAVYAAMTDISFALRAGEARKKYAIPDMRRNLFNARAADVVRLLDPERLHSTADLVGGYPTCDSESYNAEFVLSVLRRASCDARDEPSSAILDLDVVARGGLASIAIAGLSARNKPIRTLAYAALTAFADAVGPVSGVNTDAASALYRDRRQLAYVLELLKNSIKSPLQAILPLFATLVRICLQIILTPTHDAYPEVVRALLRVPVLNVLDAETLGRLLSEEAASCRTLALDVIRRGVRTIDDHYVARRRRMYECILSIGSHQPAEAARTLRAIACQAEGRVAAELVRSQGVLSWILAPTAKSPSDVNESLRLLKELADNLPRGVLRERYSAGFQQALEHLSMEVTADESVVILAARAVARLTPTRRRVFCLGRFEDKDLELAVYGRRKRTHADEDIIVNAVKACCNVDRSGTDSFPTETEEISATQAFVADAVLRDANLHKSKRIKSALACLVLDSRQKLTSWIVAACLRCIPMPTWTPELHELADMVPGSVPAQELGESQYTTMLSSSTRRHLAGLLCPTRPVAADMSSKDEKKRRRLS